MLPVVSLLSFQSPRDPVPTLHVRSGSGWGGGDDPVCPLKIHCGGAESLSPGRVITVE